MVRKGELRLLLGTDAASEGLNLQRLGEIEQAKKVIDELPKAHPFEIRYSQVEKVDWESCTQVLDAVEKRKVLSKGW